MSVALEPEPPRPLARVTTFPPIVMALLAPCALIVAALPLPDPATPETDNTLPPVPLELRSTVPEMSTVAPTTKMRVWPAVADPAVPVCDAPPTALVELLRFPPIETAPPLSGLRKAPPPVALPPTPVVAFPPVPFALRLVVTLAMLITPPTRAEIDALPPVPAPPFTPLPPVPSALKTSGLDPEVSLVVPWVVPIRTWPPVPAPPDAPLVPEPPIPCARASRLPLNVTTPFVLPEGAARPPRPKPPAPLAALLAPPRAVTSIKASPPTVRFAPTCCALICAKGDAIALPPMPSPPPRLSPAVAVPRAVAFPVTFRVPPKFAISVDRPTVVASPPSIPAEVILLTRALEETRTLPPMLKVPSLTSSCEKINASPLKPLPVAPDPFRFPPPMPSESTLTEPPIVSVPPPTPILALPPVPLPPEPEPEAFRSP